MVRISQLQFEHHEFPVIGIGESKPRLSWKFEGDNRNWAQHSYEIQIRRNDGHSQIFSKTSSDSSLIAWPGAPLMSHEEATVRVRVTGNDGLVTEWSKEESVEAGLLAREDWHSQLVQPDFPTSSGDPSRPVIFRRVINISRTAHKARLYVSAHGVYEALINDNRIGDHLLAPGWTSYKHRLVYQTFDITKYLQQGSNYLDVTVAEGWYCGKLGFNGGQANIYGDNVAVIATAIVWYSDGTRDAFGMDASCQCTTSPILASGIYAGETYDAREEMKQQSWYPVKTTPITDNLVAPTGPPVRRTQNLKPKQILTSPSGKTIVDFGQNFVGWVKVRVEGPTGTTIEFQHVEVLEDGEVATRPLRGAKAKDTLILSGQGPLTWEPKFTFHGFRYVQVEGWPGKLDEGQITGVVIHTDMQRTGFFACSNALLNKLHENVVWSMRGNFLSIPTDCPQRDERLGWTGDINVFADTANFLYDTTGMLDSWLQDLSAEQIASGADIVPLTIPNIFEFMSKDAQAVWGDVCIMLPWSMYLATGDVALLSRQYDSMRRWLNAIPRRSNGLWDCHGPWTLGDWLDPAAPPDEPGASRTDPELVSDAFLFHCTTLMARISSVLHKQSETEQYSDEAARLRRSFAHEYFAPSGRLTGNTQTAMALAIQFSLYPPNSPQLAHATSLLSQAILKTNRFRIATGFAGTPYIGHALSQVGLSNLFYRMLLHRRNPSWLYPVTMGATTIWERWDSLLPSGRVNPGEMTSFNHYALGSVAAWMHGIMVGMKPLEGRAGWRTWRVEPIPGGGISWAEGLYRSAYGECRVRWEVRSASEDDGGDIFWLRIKVPPNTQAEVKLPQREVVEMVESGWHEWETHFVQEEWPPKAVFPPYSEPDDDLPDDGVVKDPPEWSMLRV